MIPFGEWLPDQSDFENPGLLVAKNAIPAALGYRPIKALSTISNAADGVLRGITAGADPDGTTRQFAGDDSKLYLFNSGTKNLDDVSVGGGYSLGANDKWRFTQFGNRMIAVAGSAVSPQTWLLGTDTSWSDLPGSPPTAEFVAVVRDFVMLGNINDGTAYPYRVQFSQIGDPTAWTVGTNLADFQDINDLGEVTGIIGGEFGVVLCERGVVRVTFIGAPFTFQFDTVEGARGNAYKGAAVGLGPNRVFYISESGFQMLSPNGITDIGGEKVDRWFNAMLDAGNADKITSAIDPVNRIVVWSFPSVNSDGTPDMIIAYNYQLNRWTYCEIENDLVAPLYTAGYTLEDLDTIGTLEELPESLDSSFWAGGQFLFGGSTANRIATFSGSNLEACFDTGDLETSPMRVSSVNRIYPHTKGGTPTVQVASRIDHDDAVTFGAASSKNSSGFCPVRSTGRFHRLRLTISGTWEHAIGFDADFKQTGMR